jgi:hypothetical protein
VLLLGVADFGRVFSEGIALEAAARNAAEAAAQEYLQLKRNAPPAGTIDYARLHQVALDSVCEETTTLSNHASAGGSCAMPIAEVCVWDDAGGDTNCLGDAAGPPAECSLLAGTGSALNPRPGTLPYVEVRVCYQFTTIFLLGDIELPFNFSVPLGNVWLQRDRVFTVADY